MRFTKRIEDYLSQNRLWRIRFDFDNIREDVAKDTPIYITGVIGAQGKSVLKRLLVSEGYTNVKELDDAMAEAKNSIPWNARLDIRGHWLGKLERLDQELVSKYTKEGIVFDFGRSTLTAKEVREGQRWQEESWK